MIGRGASLFNADPIADATVATLFLRMMPGASRIGLPSSLRTAGVTALALVPGIALR